MPLDIIDTTNARFEPLYAQFVQETEAATFWYLPRWREYQASYCDTTFVADRSVAAVDGDRALAVCPLIIEEDRGVRRVAIRNSFAMGPLITGGLNRRSRRKVEDAVFGAIDAVATELGVAKVMSMLPFAGAPAVASPFAEHRYFETPIATHVTDLSLTTAELWAEVRGSYHSLINKAKRRLRVVVMDAKSASPELHTAYRLLHHKAAGRVTRPMRTFDLQYEMLVEDNAIVVALLDADTPVACTYFHHHHGMAYLASIADDHDFDAGVPLEHVALWTGIEYYKARGFRFLELGYQQYGPQLFAPSSHKDVTISFFKRGFPGRAYEVPRGVRYYDAVLARQDLSDTLAFMCESVMTDPAPDGAGVGRGPGAP